MRCRSPGREPAAPTQTASAGIFSRTLATTAVLLSTLAGHFWNLQIDGWCGILVGILILHGGYDAAKDTISPLLGQAPDPEFIRRITRIVTEYDEVLGIHDLIVHDYGPGRRMISLHAEVPAKGNILALHDTIDNIEKRLQRELRCSAVIHMDPVMNDDAETMACKTMAADVLSQIDAALTLHDFRMVKGTTHTNLIFDVVVPYHTDYTVEQLKEGIETRLREIDPAYCAVIQIDHP